jgi:PhnB protein
MAQPIPEGYHSVTPYLYVKGAAAAIQFYEEALGAKELMRLEGPGGTLGHAEVQIGTSRIMLADEHPDMDVLGPQSRCGTTVGFCVYVPDVDTAFARAISAGGKEVRPVQDQFYGDRSGTLLDPFGHQWTIATHMEDLDQEEVERRMAEMMQGG